MKVKVYYNSFGFVSTDFCLLLVSIIIRAFCKHVHNYSVHIGWIQDITKEICMHQAGFCSLTLEKPKFPKNKYTDSNIICRFVIWKTSEWYYVLVLPKRFKFIGWLYNGFSARDSTVRTTWHVPTVIPLGARGRIL